MNCIQARPMFSPYLDGVVTGAQMQALSKHLETCAPCNFEYSSLRQTQRLLASSRRRKAPEDLALKLRVAISREAARSRKPRLQGVRIRLENAVHAFMVPLTAGLVTAIMIFGCLMGFLALPLQANDSDVPLMLNTAPQLQQAAFGATLDSVHEGSLVIEAYVNTSGRVDDYRILYDSKESRELLPQVKNMLIFTTFRPATFMGRPTPGRAVLSFSKISVKG